jgi:hypothetical protein
MAKWSDAVAPPEPLVVGGFRRIVVPLGADTYNTCNPGVGDADGDGLDELAVPVIEDGSCRISLYRGDGAEVWRNSEVRFFNYFYDDMEAHRGTHWHAQARHRHLFTRIFDIDGDGQPEVVCADGPVWVLDARSGALKQMIELDAHVQVWCPARLDGPDAPASFVAGIEKRDGSGSAIACIGLGPEGVLEVRWITPVAGRSFEDAMWAGDVDGDGCDEIIFSTSSTGSMYLLDRAGRVRWERRIKGVIGDDTHVDDLAIAAILPGAARQILMATGPALLDAGGNIIWALGDRYQHAQRVLAVPPGAALAAGAFGPRRVYFCESFERNAYLADHDGRELWRFSGFQRVKPGFEDGIRMRLTTAGGIADWYGDGRPIIVQAESFRVRPGARGEIEGPCTGYVTLLTPEGQVVGCLPFEDVAGRSAGAMCAAAGHFTSRDADSLAVIMHCGSRAYFFSRA